MRKALLGLLFAAAIMVAPSTIYADDTPPGEMPPGEEMEEPSEEDEELLIPPEDVSVSQFVYDTEDETLFRYWDAEIADYATGIVSIKTEAGTDRYYFDETTRYVRKKYFDGNHYFGADGRAVTGKIIKVTEKGAAHYIYITVNGNRYRPTTTKVVKLFGKYYYISKTTGYLTTSKWVTATYNGKKGKYYFKANGQACIGRTKVGTKYYFFNSAGQLTGGWHKYKTTYVYYDVKTGVQKFANKYLYVANKRIMNDTSKTKYYIVSDIEHCWTFIFQGKKGNWVPIRAWKCTPGKKSTPTITGKYKVGVKGYRFGRGFSCFYYTQIRGNYLFHSVIYNTPGTKITDGRLGQKLSHGCVRLDIANAKWIYDYVPSGTTIYIYKK